LFSQRNLNLDRIVSAHKQIDIIAPIIGVKNNVVMKIRLPDRKLCDLFQHRIIQTFEQIKILDLTSRQHDCTVLSEFNNSSLKR
jgi:hypothetical protein